MRYVVLLLAVLLAGCGSEAAVSRPSTIRPELRDALEAEIAAIRADPVSSVGFGEKGYAPYEPNVAHGLITVPGEDITARLQEEIEGSGDRVYRLALLHVLGRRRDERVDPALLAALEDPDLRATAAYLLGRAGFKPYPDRPRDEGAIRAALRRHLDDDATFDDPFYRQSFRVGDLVPGAYIRLTGPKRFTFADHAVGDDVGYELPRFGDQREDLRAQAERTG
jgi:hypothetical protein